MWEHSSYVRTKEKATEIHYPVSHCTHTFTRNCQTNGVYICRKLAFILGLGCRKKPRTPWKVKIHGSEQNQHPTQMSRTISQPQHQETTQKQKTLAITVHASRMQELGPPHCWDHEHTAGVGTQRVRSHPSVLPWEPPQMLLLGPTALSTQMTVT